MDSIKQLLGDRAPSEPLEIKLIKKYVQTEFQVVVEVMVRERDIIISVGSSSLANALRLRGPDIKRLCATDKRLIFRIG